MKHPAEQFECMNCYHSGPLNEHGGCEQCHSQAVMSLELHYKPMKTESFPDQRVSA